MTADPCTATNTRPWGTGPAINCTLPADHYREDDEPTFNEDGSTLTPGGWHHGLMDGLDLRWCDRADGATPHAPADACGPECAEQHTYADGCEAAPAPPADELSAELFRALFPAVLGRPAGVHPTVVAADLAAAVLPVIEQEKHRIVDGLGQQLARVGQLEMDLKSERAQAERLSRRAAEAEAQAGLTRGELVNTRRELAELRRVSALHADTERRLTDDLRAEVRKREAAEATAETFRHKAVRRALRLARVTGVLDAIREMAAEKVTARNEWGDGYRDAIRDLNEILDGLTPKETP